MPDLILASTSPYRRILLERLGLPFRCLRPTCDEEALKEPPRPPRQLAADLADAKAASIAVEQPQAVVIGSDQLACIDEAILGKPGSVEAAVAQLAQLSGRCHSLITAVTIRCGERVQRHLDETQLTMHALDEAALRRYVDRDQPLDCAGAYKIEAGGIALFSAIDSRDHSAITGLPLIAVADLLRQHGFVIP